jgi:osmotically-inducible protein OsmY
MRDADGSGTHFSPPGLTPTSAKESIMVNSLLRRTATIALFVGVAALSACAATPRSESTGQYIDDTVITTKVKSAIFDEPALKSAEINVETFKGQVQLSGFVSSRDAINHAVMLARGVDGVTGVTNLMQLK